MIEIDRFVEVENFNSFAMQHVKVQNILSDIKTLWNLQKSGVGTEWFLDKNKNYLFPKNLFE